MMPFTAVAKLRRPLGLRGADENRAAVDTRASIPREGAISLLYNRIRRTSP